MAGLAHGAASWNELTTCSGISVGTGRTEVDAQAICDVVGATAGLWFLMSLGLAIVGVIVLRTVLVRPQAAGGPEGWTWGWGALFAVGGAIAASRLPTYSCPDDYRLDELFALCIGTDDRVSALSNLVVKGGLALVVVIFGVVLARVRWIPASVASGLSLVVWLGGMGWFLMDTVGRDLLVG